MGKVVWTKKSRSSLKEIWQFYAEKNIEAADKIINEIIETAEGIRFPEQYQIDEISGKKHRRVVVRHFKIIYLVKGDVVEILRVFDSRQNPDKLKK